MSRKSDRSLPAAQHLTIRDAADALAVDPKTIRRRIADGSLPAVRIGTRRPGTVRDTRPIRIPADALAAIVEPVTGRGAR